MRFASINNKICVDIDLNEGKMKIKSENFEKV